MSNKLLGYEVLLINCIAGLEFESGYVLLVRIWDNRGFTHSPGPTKCAFRGVRFPRIQKKSFHVRLYTFLSTLIAYRQKKITFATNWN